MQTLYKLPDTKGDQVRFAVTRTYKAPGVQSLIPHRFTSVNNSQTEPDFIGNPNLKPELALGIDASYEHYWAEGALLSASVSSRRIDDYTRNQVLFDGTRWVSTPSNAGPNNRLDAQTPVSATLGADYRRGALTVGGSYVFKNGGQVRVSANQISYQSVRRDLDLYALWKFDPKLQLRIATANLLAQDTISESSYVLAGNGTQSTRTITPLYRSVRATLEMKF
jgi:outer membrane receptor protein involved in Fe transport